MKLEFKSSFIWLHNLSFYPLFCTFVCVCVCVCVCAYIYIYIYAFFILLCFQEIIAPKVGACSPYVLDSDYNAWSVFYMTGLYFRTDKSYIILTDFFFSVFFPPPYSKKGEGGKIKIVMRQHRGNSTQICSYQEPWVWLSCPLVPRSWVRGVDSGIRSGSG